MCNDTSHVLCFFLYCRLIFFFFLCCVSKICCNRFVTNLVVVSTFQPYFLSCMSHFTQYNSGIIYLFTVLLTKLYNPVSLPEAHVTRERDWEKRKRERERERFARMLEMEYLNFCLLFWEKSQNSVSSMATDKGQTQLFKKAHALFRLVFLLFHCQSFIGTKHVCVFGYNHLHILTQVMPPGAKGNKNTAHICAFAVAKPWLQTQCVENMRYKFKWMFQDFMFDFNCVLSLDLIDYFLYSPPIAFHTVYILYK